MSLFDQDRVLGFQNDGSLDIYANSLRTNNQQGVAKFSSTGNIISVEKLSADDVDVDISGLEADVVALETKTQNISYDSGDTKIEEALIIQGNVNGFTRIQDDLITIENPPGSLQTTLRPSLISLGSGVGGSLYANSQNDPAGHAINRQGIYQRAYQNEGYFRIGGNGSVDTGGGAGTGVIIVGGAPGRGSLTVNGLITAEDAEISGNLELGALADVEQEINDLKTKTQNISYDSGDTKIATDLVIDNSGTPGVRLQHDRILVGNAGFTSNVITLGAGAGGQMFYNSASDHPDKSKKGFYVKSYNNNGNVFIGGNTGDGNKEGKLTVGGEAGNTGTVTVHGTTTTEELVVSGTTTVNNLSASGTMDLGDIKDLEQEINDIKAQTPDMEGVTMLNVKTAGLNADKIVYEDDHIRLRWKNDATQYQIQVKTPGELTPGNKSPLYFRHGNNVEVLAGTNVDTLKWYFWSATETKDGSHDVGMTTFRNMGLYSSLDVSTPFPSYIFELLHIATSVNLVITKLSTPYS